MHVSKANAVSLEHEIDWFSTVLGTRISLYFEQECEYCSIYDVPPPALEANASEYAGLVHECGLNVDERLVLILTLMPHLRLAEDYELSGGAIANVVRYGAIRALQHNDRIITPRDLLRGIAKEMYKEGKTA